jgi:hypothetical protein
MESDMDDTGCGVRGLVQYVVYPVGSRTHGNKNATVTICSVRVSGMEIHTLE